MTYYLFPIIVSLFLCGVTSSHLIASHNSTSNQLATCPHAVYAGPLVVGATFDVDIAQASVSATRAMGGIEFGYEYLKLQFLYANLHFGFADGSSAITGIENNIAIPTDSNHPVWSEAELRLGYPYAKNDWIVTPFVGTGWLFIGTWDASVGFHSSLFFVGGGCKINYSLSSCYSIGCDIELLGNVIAQKSYYGSYETYKQNAGGCGGRFALPSTWTVDSCNRWKIRLEPFVLSFNFSETELIYGAMLFLAHQF